MNRIWSICCAIMMFAAISACKNAPASGEGDSGDQVAESTMTLDIMGGTAEEQAMPMKIGIALSQGSFAGEALRSNSKEEAAFNLGTNREVPGAYMLKLEFVRQGKRVKVVMPFYTEQAQPGTYALGISKDTLVMKPTLDLVQPTTGGLDVEVKGAEGSGTITLDYFQPEDHSVRGKASIIFPEVSEIGGGASKTYKNVNLQVVFNNQ